MALEDDQRERTGNDRCEGARQARALPRALIEPIPERIARAVMEERRERASGASELARYAATASAVVSAMARDR